MFFKKHYEKVDVTLIAKRLGGGGHRNASGFVWPSSDIETLFDSFPRRVFYKLHGMIFGQT